MIYLVMGDFSVSGKENCLIKNKKSVNTLANFLSFCLFIAALLSFGFHTSRHLDE